MLRRYTWEKVRSECQHYRRRQPETTELYRIITHSREELEYIWELRFQQRYGYLRKVVLKALDEYLHCGLLEHGLARIYCDSCRKSLLVAFSCKRRGVCPSCSSKRAVKFAEHVYSSVIEDVPHRHVVFSIPKRLRPYFRYKRKLSSILFKSANKSVREVLGEKGTPALMLTLQTAGDALNWNPHLHGILADGVFDESGSFIQITYIDIARIQRRFEEIVLTEFCKLGLLTDDISSQILSQEHTGFSVWVGEPFGDKDSEHFVARYIERGPVSLERLSIQDDIVTYTTKDSTAHEFEPLEFLALLTSHIPDRYESITRYYGWYSCRSRGERKKLEALEAEEVEQIPEEDIKPSSSWVALIKRAYELDPLECPRCKGKMRIISFLTDSVEIKKIMRSQGIAEYRAPPPIPKAPAFSEQEFVQEAPDDDVWE